MNTPVSRRCVATPLLPGIKVDECISPDAWFTVEKDCPMMVTCYGIDEQEFDVHMISTGCDDGSKAVTNAAGEDLVVNMDNACVVLVAVGRYQFVARDNGSTYAKIRFEVAKMTPAQIMLMGTNGAGFSVG